MPPGEPVMSAAFLLLTSVLALVPVVAFASASSGPGMHRDESDAASQQAWHARRLAALAAPDGWLTLVGLDFLSDGTHSVGRGPGVAFSYAGCADAEVGRFEVAGERVRFVAAPGAMVAVEQAAEDGMLRADDVGTPSVVRSGTVSFTLVRRNGRLALRVRDSASPVRTEFKGVRLMPFDPALVVEATVVPAPADRTISITNVTGFVEAQPVAAELRFVLAGEPRTLVATPGSNGRLFVVFGDATNGRETYGGGRFLDLPAPDAGRVTIDFNRAFNPPCAFTPFATCPMPPARNRLPIAVTAGELAPEPVAYPPKGGTDPSPVPRP